MRPALLRFAVVDGAPSSWFTPTEPGLRRAAMNFVSIIRSITTPCLGCSGSCPRMERPQPTRTIQSPFSSHCRTAHVLRSTWPTERVSPTRQRSRSTDGTSSATKSAPHVNGRGQQTKHHPANDKAGRSDDVLYFRKPRLRSEVGPAFLLQLRQVNDACWNDDGFGDKGDRLALFFLHVFLGVVTSGKLNRAGESIILQLLDPV